MFAPYTLHRQYSNDRPGPPLSNLCHCSCHYQAKEKPPLAVEARLCQGCADERFQSWADFVEITLR